jgi:hypothetical protein
MKIVLFIILFACGLVSAQTNTPPDRWKPLRVFVGTWVGSGKGGAGEPKVEREYKFVLNNKFLQATHRSTYVPPNKNSKGEIHDDLGFFSYDRVRKQFVFRQFLVEGLVIQFLVSSISEDGKTIILDSESIENPIPKGIRSRETYKILDDNEFTETYEIAEAGKDFVVYFVKHFKRTASRQNRQLRN